MTEQTETPESITAAIRIIQDAIAKVELDPPANDSAKSLNRLGRAEFRLYQRLNWVISGLREKALASLNELANEAQ